MKKRIILLLAVMFIALIQTPAAADGVGSSLKYTAPLQEELKKNPSQIDVMIYFHDDFNPYKTAAEGEIGETVREREISGREALIDGLKECSDATQARALEMLVEAKKDGEVVHYEDFYIVNAIHVVGTISAVESLASLPEVKVIDRNGSVRLQTVEPSAEEIGLNVASSADDFEPTDVGWEMTSTRVIDVWKNIGALGANVVIGFIDSGVDWTHPAIKEQWRGYDSVMGKVDAKENWLDLIGNAQLPVDNVSHGTTMVGAALGRESDGANAIGVAPRAKWIAVRAFSTNSATNENIIKAGQWMLAPGGNPAAAPDIINNSWGAVVSSEPWFNEIVDAWLAAGILPVFAAGNDTEEAKDGSIENPASLPSTLAVGAVDRNNKIGSFSKRGPSSFDKTGKIIKPELVAPGINIRTAVPGGYDFNWMGTSLAAAHVSGIAALVKSENPFLTPQSLKEILVDTATPLSDSIYVNTPNMAYGYGLVDALAAVAIAKDLNHMERVFGYSRYDTAVEISRTFYEPGVTTVYIANGVQFADGLSMGPMTSDAKGPLLLAERNGISEKTLDEILRLKPTNIVIVGGSNAVSENVAARIRAVTSLTPMRIAGYSRFDTAAEIAKTVHTTAPVQEVFLVNGYREADAISIASASTRDRIPVLLTGPETLHPSTKAALKTMRIAKVTVIGGPLVVKDSILNEIRSMGIDVERVSGQTRFDTSAVVNEKYFPTPTEGILANGIFVADALTAGPVAGSLGCPVIILSKDAIADSAMRYVKKIGRGDLYVFGGPNALSNKVLSAIMMAK